MFSEIFEFSWWCKVEKVKDQNEHISYEFVHQKKWNTNMKISSKQSIKLMNFA